MRSHPSGEHPYPRVALSPGEGVKNPQKTATPQQASLSSRTLSHVLASSLPVPVSPSFSDPFLTLNDGRRGRDREIRPSDRIRSPTHPRIIRSRKTTKHPKRPPPIFFNVISLYMCAGRREKTEPPRPEKKALPEFFFRVLCSGQRLRGGREREREREKRILLLSLFCFVPSEIFFIRF